MWLSFTIIHYKNVLKKLIKNYFMSLLDKGFKLNKLKITKYTAKLTYLVPIPWPLVPTRAINDWNPSGVNHFQGKKDREAVIKKIYINNIKIKLKIASNVKIISIDVII